MFPGASVGKIAFSGHEAAYRQLREAANNLLNATDPDYSRVVSQAAPRVSPDSGCVSGVQVVNVRREADQVLHQHEASMRQALASWTVRETMQERIQNLFRPIGDKDSLPARMDDFFQRIAAAARDPSDPTLRAQIIGAGKGLGYEFRRFGEGLSKLRLQADEKISDGVKSVNRLLHEYKVANTDLARVEALRGSGSSPGLADRREMLFREISEHLPVYEDPQPDGSCILRLSSGELLVQDNHVAELSFKQVLTVEPGAKRGAGLGGIELKPICVTNAAAAAPPIDISRVLLDSRLGGLYGALKARDSDLFTVEQQIDLLAAQFRDQINEVHSMGAGIVGRSSWRSAAPVATQTYELSGVLRIALVHKGTGHYAEVEDIDFTASGCDGNTPLHASNLDRAIANPFRGELRVRLDRDGYLILEATDPEKYVVFLRAPGEELATDRGSGRSFIHLMGFNNFFQSPAPDADRVVGAATRLKMTAELRANPGYLSLALPADPLGDIPFGPDNFLARHLSYNPVRPANPSEVRAIDTGNGQNTWCLHDILQQAFQFPAVGGLPAAMTRLGQYCSAVLEYSAKEKKRITGIIKTQKGLLESAERARLQVSGVDEIESLQLISELSQNLLTAQQMIALNNQVEKDLLKLLE